MKPGPLKSAFETSTKGVLYQEFNLHIKLILMVG